MLRRSGFRFADQNMRQTRDGRGDTPRPGPLPRLSAALILAFIVLAPASDAALAGHHQHRVVARARHPAKPHKAEKFEATGPAVPDVPRPFRIRDAGLEPIDWDKLDGWAVDDHAAAFATFLVSCRPIAITAHPAGENRPMYAALHAVCRRALKAGKLDEPAARKFFEDNFRPARIAKLGDAAGFLTGYYEPIVDGSRFPTPIYHVPIYRRPPDLLPPAGTPSGAGFPNAGQSLRRDGSGKLVPYYDRAQIEDGALDGQHLELCWIKDATDALFIQIQGSARIRLEDGLMLRINYDSHNGFPYTPVGRILIDRKMVPRDQMSMDRIRQWIRDNPDGAKELRRQNRSFVFFRIVGLGDDEEPLGAQGLPLTAGRSIAVDKALHVYGTPFFIRADLPIDSPTAKNHFRRLMIAQDTGSAIVGPARADLYWGAGKQAGLVAGRLKDHGQFTMLIPREIDPAVTGAQMPLPLPRPVDLIARQAQPKLAPPGRTAARGAAPTPLPQPKPKRKP
jgi:membrane-bound lytic murein transglycosylase A